VKGLFRSAVVQEILGFLLGGYLWFVRHTIRWRMINRAPVDAQLEEPIGVLSCLWHGRIAASMGAASMALPHRNARALISLSQDGEFIAKAMAWQGMPAFRGSSRKTKDPKRVASGSTAYRQSLEFVRKGGILVLTPDGPRGPAEEIAEGVVRMAVRTGAPVVLIGLATDPVIRLKTWDSMILPIPFGRGRVVYDGPLFAPPDADDAAILAMRKDWAARLSAATGAAEEALK
jgi:lysophospholipid acyltransferase (LPLAT)-like uncharacterized protein